MPESTSTRLIVHLRCLHEDCLNYNVATYTWAYKETGKIFLDEDVLICPACQREMELEL